MLRFAVSLLLHVTAVLLVASFRFSSPGEPVSRHQVVILASPIRSLPKAILPRVPDRASPIPRPARRGFVLPTWAAAVAPRQLALEVAALNPPVAVEPSSESYVSAALPPPPVIVGKLATASASVPAASRQGAVRSSSFAVAASELTQDPEPRRTTRPTGFGEVAALVGRSSQPSLTVVKATGVEILSKPRPLYTEEARRLRIEGEVLLEVLFAASGATHVERVLRGLGHGLDEAAVASALQIQFRPATREGLPVDQTATVHIIFQLAY